MHNRDLKQELITKEVYQQYCNAHNEFYINGLNPEDRKLYVFLNDTEYKACNQLRRAKQIQRNRIIKWLDYYMKQSDLIILFGTQTFNEKALTKSRQARAKAIQRELTQFVDYVSNIDYGKQHEREHYHFIVVVRPEDLKEVTWSIDKKTGRPYALSLPVTENYLSLGFQKWEKIDLNDPKISEKVSGYIAKLVNHSLKVEQTKLGYKRNSPYQAFLADLTNLKNKRDKNLMLTENDYIQAYKWLDNRQLMEWLEDPIKYSLPL